MRNLILFFALAFAACQKPEVETAVVMPDLSGFDRNAKAARLYLEPHESAKTDSLIYFTFPTERVTIITETWTVNGLNTTIICSGKNLVVDQFGFSMFWTKGPLAGKRELLKPTDYENGYTEFTSDFRVFWIKTK